MIAPGTAAPDFYLPTQFGTKFHLADYRGQNVLLLFYPNDWTPTCSGEVPALEDYAARFKREAGTQVVALSVDSKHCHANWAAALGGISYPLLADDRPKGKVAHLYGTWLEGNDSADRATVWIDRAGVVRYAASAGLKGRRDMDALLATATQLDRAQGVAPAAGAAVAPARSLAPGFTSGVLYVADGCPHCRTAKAALVNAHADKTIQTRDVVSDPAAAAALQAIRGSLAVPVLVAQTPYSGQEVYVGPTAITAALYRAFVQV